MTIHYKIKRVLPVAGDWYWVSNPEDNRWFIERVVAWALVEAKSSIDHLRAITSNGIPHLDDDGDSYFVFGDDMSPLGILWRDVHQNCPASPLNVREITDISRGFLWDVPASE